MQLTMFKLLLENFVDKVTLTTVELNQAKLYIFGEVTDTEIIQDEEIQETIEYLKEIVEENGFSTVEELSGYLKRRKKGYAKFLWEAMDDVDAQDTPSEIHIHEAPMSVAISGSYYRSSYIYKQPHLDNFEQMLQEYLTKFSTYCKEVIGRTLRNNLSSMVDLNSNINSYCNAQRLTFNHISAVKGFCRYFEEFADSDNNGELFVWKSLANDHPVHTGGVLYFGDASAHGCLDATANNRKPRGQNDEVAIIYRHILDYLQTETPIDDHTIKEEMVDWLCYTKFHRSDVAKFQALKEISSTFSCTFASRMNELFSPNQKRAMVKKKQEYKSLLLLKKWKILKSPVGHNWLTSDNPGFAIHLTAAFDHTIALTPDSTLEEIREDTVIYFPLSSEYCLRIQPAYTSLAVENYRRETAIEFEQSSDLELEVVNGLTFSTKNEIVIAKNKKTIEHLASA